MSISTSYLSRPNLLKPIHQMSNVEHYYWFSVCIYVYVQLSWYALFIKGVNIIYIGFDYLDRFQVDLPLLAVEFEKIKHCGIFQMKSSRSSAYENLSKVVFIKEIKPSIKNSE